MKAFVGALQDDRSGFGVRLAGMKGNASAF